MWSQEEDFRKDVIRLFRESKKDPRKTSDALKKIFSSAWVDIGVRIARPRLIG